MKSTYIAAGLGFLAYAVLAAFVPGWIGTPVDKAWILRIALWIFGLAAVALIVYFRTSPAPAKPAASRQPEQTGIPDLIRAANARLAAAPAGHRGARNLAGLPLALFIGDPGSAKTTSVIRSGLDPELLAGQIHDGDAVIATPTVNLWLTGGSAIAEAGGTLITDFESLRSLVVALRARRLTSLLGRSAQAPRSIVLCCDCALLSGTAARSAAETARKYRALLGEIAQLWGSRLPVYVLFTKLDQVAYFSDYIRHLSATDAAAPFGTCLPVPDATPAEPYGDRQSKVLNAAFDALFLGLAERRLECLAAEDDPARVPNIYEFPREFRKLRERAVQFLVEVGRPSHLLASPFLRGFYFSGVRPVVVDVAEEITPRPVAARAADFDAGATRIFTGEAQARAARPAAPLEAGPRRRPEWVFLREFFVRVLLADAPAHFTSARSTRAGIARRVIAGTVLGVFAVWMTGAAISRYYNGSLVTHAAEAAAAIDGMRLQEGQTSAEALRRLETLRASTALALGFERDLPLMSYRWGVYPGSRMAEQLQGLYCREADKILLAELRLSFAAQLAGLPNAPAPNADYTAPFESLRAYLMMTSQGKRVEVGPLAGFLTKEWTARHHPIQEEQELAARQFQFYAAGRLAGMCPATEDLSVVQRARAYLWRFQPAVRIYDDILRDAGRGGAPFSFIDANGAVVAKEIVPFAYTKAGWALVQARIADAARYFNRDPWVLGDRPTDVPAAGAGLQQELRQRYTEQYLQAWQTFLASAHVANYSSLEDAANKLNGLAAPQSSLLRLFCGISVNTAVDAPELQKVFAGIAAMEPPATCESRPNDAATQRYIIALGRVKFQVEAMAQNPNRIDAAVDSTEAKTEALTIASQNSLPETARDLLVAPLVNLDRAVRKSSPEALNKKGRAMCGGAARLFDAFPFNPKAAAPFSAKDFDDFFRPEKGQLARFVQENLQASGARVEVTPEFRRFLDWADAIRKEFYPPNAPGPVLRCTVTAGRSAGIQKFSLAAGPRTLNGTLAGGEHEEFAWNGEDLPAVLHVDTHRAATFRSLWHLIYSGVKAPEDWRDYNVTTLVAGQVSSDPVYVRLRFSPAILSQLTSRCVSQVAR